MFIRNGKVTGSVLHSAVPAAKAEPSKSAPAKKTPPAPAKKSAVPAVTSEKEASRDGDNDETR